MYSRYDTDGNQILADKDMKTVTINVFYMFKKVSMNRKYILKNPNWTYTDKNYNVWDLKKYIGSNYQ